MLADEERYKIHLDQAPDLIERIRDDVYRLNTAFPKEQPEIAQEQQVETISINRSIKL